MEPGGHPGVGFALRTPAERDVVEAQDDQRRAGGDDLVDLAAEGLSVVGVVVVHGQAR